jgi:hypothetical protein
LLTLVVSLLLLLLMVFHRIFAPVLLLGELIPPPCANRFVNALPTKQTVGVVVAAAAVPGGDSVPAKRCLRFSSPADAVDDAFLLRLVVVDLDL